MTSSFASRPKSKMWIPGLGQDSQLTPLEEATQGSQLPGIPEGFSWERLGSQAQRFYAENKELSIATGGLLGFTLLLSLTR